MHELIRDITLCILFAWVLGLLAHFSRQPLILAYLIAGFLIGPFGVGLVKSQESINVISELGLIFMLFMIWLEIDLKKIVRAGKVILFAAGGQLIGGFLIGEIAERLHLSREMGSLVAGVSLSTFPYALDVTAKVTTLRDFFITLFFVALGMTIPIPGASVIGLALMIAAFTVVSRMVTTFAPLYLMKQGLRASLLPAINLAQISEFSLVVIQTGVTANHISTETSSAVSFAFVVLAVVSTFVMARSDQVTRGLIGPLKRIGLRDLDHKHEADAGHEGGHGEARRIVILGFFRAASALLAEIERRSPAVLEQITVIDFNPMVFRTLTDRGMHVVYGDISNVDTLVHAGVGKSELIILSIPDSLLEGADNEKLVRHVRSLNPTAKIVATAEILSEVNDLYASGADYVTVTRLSDADELYKVIEAVQAGLLEDKRAETDVLLSERREVLP